VPQSTEKVFIFMRKQYWWDAYTATKCWINNSSYCSQCC